MRGVSSSDVQDYFRARDSFAVAKLMRKARWASPVLLDASVSVADGVEAKEVDPTVILGQLVAMVRGVEFNVSVVKTDLVWPTGWRKLLPWEAWVEVIDAKTTNDLAAIDPRQISSLGSRWSQIEEFSRGSWSVADLQQLVLDLSRLARRTVDAGDQLYVWTCL